MPARKPVMLSTEPIVEHGAAIHSEAFKKLPMDHARQALQIGNRPFGNSFLD
jgi:hypothetical protein